MRAGLWHSSRQGRAGDRRAWRHRDVHPTLICNGPYLAQPCPIDRKTDTMAFLEHRDKTQRTLFDLRASSGYSLTCANQATNCSSRQPHSLNLRPHRHYMTSVLNAHRPCHMPLTTLSSMPPSPAFQPRSPRTRERPQAIDRHPSTSHPSPAYRALAQTAMVTASPPPPAGQLRVSAYRCLRA